MKAITDKNITHNIFIFFLFFFLLIMAGGIGGDGVAYYEVAKSIIFNKSISVNMEGILGRGGKMYLPYGLTFSLVMIPFYLVGLLASNLVKFLSREYITMFFVSSANCFISALTCAFMFKFARKLGFLRKTGLILVLIYVFTSMALSYAKTTFCEPLNSLFILCGVMALYSYKLDHRKSQLIAAAAFFGLGVLTKFYDIIVLPVAAWYIWAPGQKSGNAGRNKLMAGLLAFLATFTVFLIIWGLINYLKFGDFLKTGYKNYSFSTFYTGLYGLLFSSGRSFFLYNPVTILGILGLRELYKRFPKDVILFALVVFLHFILISLLPIWSGGLAWGPRYLFPVLPYLILPLGALIENFKKSERIKRYIFLAFCALGFLIQLPSVIINFARWEDILLNVLKFPDEIFLFIPGFSPVFGSWVLLGSALQKACSGHPLIHNFVLGGFSSPINLSAYDNLNLWFLRLLSVDQPPAVLIGAYLSIAIILSFMFFSGISLYKGYKEQR